MHGLFLQKIIKELQLLMLFKKNLDESNLKPNKIGLDIVYWPFRMTLTFITYRFLFHFMLVVVQEDQKSRKEAIFL